MSGSEKTDIEYWESYTSIQIAKHEILRRYLGGWFPILSKFNGRMLYIDCHAGRGRHGKGQAGSPLIALTTLMNHAHRDRILAKTEVMFFFLEQNPDHVANLEQELKDIGTLPKNISAEITRGAYESVLDAELEDLAKREKNLAPSFFFVDPYGFSIPMVLMRKLLAQPRAELLITFMVRWIDMAVANISQEANMDLLFDVPEWRKLKDIREPDVRHAEMIKLYAKSLGCAHASVLQMRGEHREHKYSLIHATNHPRGRELMKNAMWKVTPDGSFTIFQSDHPDQQILITPEPNLDSLKGTLMETFAGREVRYDKLKEWLLPLSWDYPHLNAVLRDLRNDGKINASGFSARFAFEKNPLFKFPVH